MKAHPTFEMFAKLLMGEWNKIEYEMDHLESGYTASDMNLQPPWLKGKDRNGSIMLL